MVMIDLLIKIFPEINGKIVFVGCMKRTDRFEDLVSPKGNLERYEQHYLLTDKEGYIKNISEGLNYTLGLHPKFFNRKDINMQ